LDAFAPKPDERLLRSIAEQLKIPLTRIARQSELGADDSLEHIKTHSQEALRLVEAYLLTSYLHGQHQLQLEPVSLKALLYDVAHELEPRAKQLNTTVQLVPKGRIGLVMANAPALRQALTLLASSFFDQYLEEELSSTRLLMLRAFTYEGKVQTGVYGNSHLTQEAVQAGKSLYGKARQAVPAVLPSPATEIYLADALLATMACSLHVSRHGEQAGLVTSLTPSQQLALITA
jgi:hypothetical protein